jgi:hypothetical protein
MTCYIVIFETRTEASRQQVVNRLMELKYYCPIHEHCWAIMSDQKSVDIAAALWKVMDPLDRLFVIRSGTEATWYNTYGEKNNEWLKKNL